MSNVSFTNLSAVSSLTTSDQTLVVQGGVAKRATVNDVLNAINGAGFASPLSVGAATQVGQAVNKGQIDSRVGVSVADALVASGHSAANDTEALNYGSVWCRDNYKKMLLDAVTYTLTDTWWLGYQTSGGGTFASLEVVGHGGGYDVGSSASKARTIIDASALTTKPAIAMQYVRAARLKGFAIKGPNLAPASLAIPTNVTSDWLTNGVRNDRYSPQCGIAIDPTADATPSGGGYSGFTYGQPTAGSAGIVLEDVQFRGHNVCLMVSPCSGTLQGDQVALHECGFYDSHIAWSNGQSQANAHEFNGGNYSKLRTVWDTTTYGAQSGPPPRVRGGQIGNAYRLICLADAYKLGGLQDLACESIVYIGNYGLGSSTSKYPLDFKRCAFHTRGLWSTPPFWLENYGPVRFDTCAFIDNDQYPNDFHMAGDGSVELNNCVIKVLDTTRAMILPYRDLGKRVALRRTRLFDATTNLEVTERVRLFSLPARVTATSYTDRIVSGTTKYEYVNGKNNTYVNTGVVSGWSIDGTTKVVTFTYTNAGLQVPLVGDIIHAQMLANSPGLAAKHPALKITAISGTGPWTVTATPFCDLTLYDPAFAPSSIDILVNEWAPGAVVSLTTVSGSPNATVSPTTVLQTGDWIAATTGVPGNTRALLVSGGSVTLNQNASASGTVSIWYGGLNTVSLTRAF